MHAGQLATLSDVPITTIGAGRGGAQRVTAAGWRPAELRQLEAFLRR
jgi:hypothetical protein